MNAFSPISFRRLNRWLCLPTVFLVCLAMTGCIQPSGIPGIARAGDTIVLGVGGIKRNSGDDQFFTLSDIQQVTITDANNQTFTLSPDYVFKAFPGNRAALNTIAIDGRSPTVPFDGGWFLVVTLSDPNSVPLPLAVGQAHIAVQSNKLANTADYFEGDLDSIAVEILAGQNSPNSGSLLQQLRAYLEMPGLVVTPENLNGISSVAGLQLRIKFTRTAAYRTDIDPMVVPIAHHPYVQVAQRMVDLGASNKAINVMVTTQKEFSNSHAADSPSLNDLNLAVMYFEADENNPVTNQQLLQDFTIDTANSYYVDKLGNKISGLNPSLSIK